MTLSMTMFHNGSVPSDDVGAQPEVGEAAPIDVRSPEPGLLERRGTRLFVRSIEGGMSADGAPEPVGFLETVIMEGATEPVRVRFFERDGTRVLVRQVDPGEPEPERVPLYPGDELIVMLAISHVGVHTNPEPGSIDGFLFSHRVVPVREEPGRVFARTLRLGERDTGQRVHVRPRDNMVFEEGAIVAELDHIDQLEVATESGHVSLTPVLWTWLSLRSGHEQVKTRYLLAAARRLDTANLLLIEVQHRRHRLEQDGLAGPEIRRNWFELVGAVELAVVALGRAVDMVVRAAHLMACTVPVPAQVLTSHAALNEIRNAYEHIEDRALGQVRRKPDPTALTIFDQQRLLADDVIVYGEYELELSGEVPRLLSQTRQFLKDAAADG